MRSALPLCVLPVLCVLPFFRKLRPPPDPDLGDLRDLSFLGDDDEAHARLQLRQQGRSGKAHQATKENDDSHLYAEEDFMVNSMIEQSLTYKKPQGQKASAIVPVTGGKEALSTNGMPTSPWAANNGMPVTNGSDGDRAIAYPYEAPPDATDDAGKIAGAMTSLGASWGHLETAADTANKEMEKTRLAEIAAMEAVANAAGKTMIVEGGIQLKNFCCRS